MEDYKKGSRIIISKFGYRYEGVIVGTETKFGRDMVSIKISKVNIVKNINDKTVPYKVGEIMEITKVSLPYMGKII